MKFWQIGLLGLLMIQMAGCGLEAVPTSTLDPSDASAGVIYGDNSIQDVSHSFPNSSASVALMKKSTFEDFQAGKGAYTVEENYGTFPELDWTQQPSMATCSGVLIHKDLVLTAGHCVKDTKDCENLLIVFDYETNLKKPTAVACKEVVARKNDLEKSGLDYAILRLEKAVSVTPVVMGTKNLKTQDTVYSLGYPLGSYKKKAEGRIRKRLSSTDVYVSNLDVFEGNSGSPVFSKTTNLLVGILSSGEEDFVELNQETGETRVKHCENSKCSGEFIIPIQKILADMDKET